MENITLNLISHEDPDYDKNFHCSDLNSFWYLHGDLEKIFGYDKAGIIDCPKELLKDSYYVTHNDKEEKRIIDKLEIPFINGIYPVKIKGVNEPCLGYFYTTPEIECIIVPQNKLETEIRYTSWEQRGYVVLESDKDAIKDAERIYNIKSQWI